MSSTTVEHDLLLKSLEKYYSSNAKINTKIIDIIEGKSPISLRLIDWYVTTYCKSNNVVLTKNKREGYFNVYMNYRAQLKAFKKIQFDPFRRRERIMFWFATKDSSGISTTIGQLNFFKWAIEHEIIDYITKNYNEIEKDMNERNSISKKKNGTADSNESVELTLINDHGKTRKKREELSISACKCIKKENVKIVVSFN